MSKLNHRSQSVLGWLIYHPMAVTVATLTRLNRPNSMNNCPSTRTSKRPPVNRHNRRPPRHQRKSTTTETTPVVRRFLTIHSIMQQNYPSTNRPSSIPVRTLGTLPQDKDHPPERTTIHRATVTFRSKCPNNHSPLTCPTSNITPPVFRSLQLSPTTTKLHRTTPQHPHCHQNQPMPSSTSRAKPTPRRAAALYPVPAR